ncbi:LacI family DNA-binding transcriptional regulator [Flavonifractor plautii]|nr:LacI family DNA-binding transcriptional regulator [Flavonifractor plautii]
MAGVSKATVSRVVNGIEQESALKHADAYCKL